MVQIVQIKVYFILKYFSRDPTARSCFTLLDNMWGILKMLTT
jgi:hypothetical protein